MWLKLAVGDMTLELRIKDYVPGTEDVDLKWCHVDMKLTQEPFLKYEVQDVETISSWELDQLTVQLDRLTSGLVEEATRLELIQPDYTFKMWPKENFRKICLDWEIHLYEEGLKTLGFTLDEKNVQYLWIYFNYCTGALPESHEAVGQLLNDGIFVG